MFMFERIRFSFRYVTNGFLDSPTVYLFYDELEKSLYCYSESTEEPEIITNEANRIVEELEKTDFRSWYNLSNPFITDGISWTLEYCDRNKVNKYISGSNAFPKGFKQFFEIIIQLFPTVKFPIMYDYSSYIQFFSKSLGHHILPYKKMSQKELLKELCDYIPIFENKNADLSEYKKDIKKYQKLLRKIVDTCPELDLYNDRDILDAYFITDYGIELERKMDIRTALLMLISYSKSVFYDNRFETAFKSGKILELINFIKKNIEI